MVQSFGQNAVGDIYINSSGLLQVDTGVQAIEDACATATRSQLGEMVFATESGIPNFQTLWVGIPNLALWKSAILNTLQGVEGVTGVNSLNLTVSGNTVSYVAQITTIYSEIPISITG